MVVFGMKLFAQMIAGAGLGMTVLAILVGLLAFNGDDWYHDDKIGIQLGMKVDLTEQETFMWMHAPRGLYIYSKIHHVLSIDEDGNQANSSLTELFPVSDATAGEGRITVEIYTAEDHEVPDLGARNQSLMPFAFINKDSAFPTIIRWILLLGAVTINNWSLFKAFYLMGAGATIITGVGLLILTKKSEPTTVEEIAEDVE